jgi:hypothetical protein
MQHSKCVILNITLMYHYNILVHISQQLLAQYIPVAANNKTQIANMTIVV